MAVFEEAQHKIFFYYKALLDQSKKQHHSQTNNLNRWQILDLIHKLHDFLFLKNKMDKKFMFQKVKLILIYLLSLMIKEIFRKMEE
jgi:hypothetical protein